MTASCDPTVVVELTPPGRAAVAVVFVAGSDALDAVRHFFFPATPWDENGPPIGRIMLGRWGGEHGEELVVCRRCEDKFEIHSHGGAAAADAIIQRLVEHGCQRLTWRDWLRWPRRRVSPTREFESRRDSTTCAAEIALTDAPTARTASVLLDQYHGALSNAVDAVRAALVASDTTGASEIIDGILAFRDLGLHLTTPWRIVIAGPPNVGKSSLINAIAGYQRAIVSPLPGTTRDVVTITTAINGWPVQFSDTAGLRETSDEVESAGVALTGAALEQAELVILVSDASADSHDAREVLNRLPQSARLVHAVNKIDLVAGSRDARARYSSQFGCCETQSVSALTGQGIAELLVAVERSLVPAAPPAGAAVAFTRLQIAGLEAARAAIDRGDCYAADAALAAVLSTNDEVRGPSSLS